MCTSSFCIYFLSTLWFSLNTVYSLLTWTLCKMQQFFLKKIFALYLWSRSCCFILLVLLGKHPCPSIPMSPEVPRDCTYLPPQPMLEAAAVTDKHGGTGLGPGLKQEPTQCPRDPPRPPPHSAFVPCSVPPTHSNSSEITPQWSRLMSSLGEPPSFPLAWCSLN